MKRRDARAWIVVVILVASFAGAQEGLDPQSLEVLGPAAGSPRSGAELERVTEEVTSLMRCPVCQGLSVADSPTPSALAMKAKAEALLAAGYDSEQVLVYFETSYGEFIRLAPKARGFNLFVWLVPALFLLLGGWLIWRRVGGKPSAVSATDPDLEAYRERVQREVGQ